MSTKSLYLGTDSTLSNQSSWGNASNSSALSLMIVPSNFSISGISIWATTDGQGNHQTIPLYIDISNNGSNWTRQDTFNIELDGTFTNWVKYSFTLSQPITAKFMRIQKDNTTYINNWLAGISQTSGLYEGLLLRSNANPGLVCELDVSYENDWYMDTDGYPVTIPCAANCHPFEGFDNPYGILDVWKLDSNNEGYPWTFGWDAPSPISSGWYIKLSDGTFAPLTWYIKLSDGTFAPLTWYIKRSGGVVPL